MSRKEGWIEKHATAIITFILDKLGGQMVDYKKSIQQKSTFVHFIFWVTLKTSCTDWLFGMAPAKY